MAKRSREVQSPDIAAHFFLENSYVVTVESFDDRQFFSPVTIQVPELNITSGDIQQLLRDPLPILPYCTEAAFCSTKVQFVITICTRLDLHSMVFENPILHSF